MKKGIVVVAALLFGSVFGAGVRGAVSEASAQPAAAARLEYKVVSPSFGAEGYEEDLNRMSAEGFHFAGTIPGARTNGFLVFERNR